MNNLLMQNHRSHLLKYASSSKNKEQKNQWSLADFKPSIKPKHKSLIPEQILDIFLDPEEFNIKDDMISNEGSSISHDSSLLYFAISKKKEEEIQSEMRVHEAADMFR